MPAARPTCRTRHVPMYQERPASLCSVSLLLSLAGRPNLETCLPVAPCDDM